ncbi:hypothetical protein NG796_07015 [Laspinema sp. A4]|uniref:hypothetical protein n=1 Tax=Laspinema sp. D2d TaxID=2953686 RepID=UPI0021BB78E2|nr:hypothetical protein [Laspinema sp. D2d]MCT7983040.1 hypothetical protein [Laspinema sp. D2d]
MNGNSGWEKMGPVIQDRLWEATPKTDIESAIIFKRKIFKTLNTASDEQILKTKPHEIHKLLKMEKSGKHGKEVFSIMGGPKNLKRRQDLPHFERADRCWFDFAILIDENPNQAQVLGFNFEIRFPEDFTVKFLRFDLNPPGHDNDKGGIRFHLHPGHENLRIPSPPLCPLEILHLFLYGLSIPDRPRSI